MSRHSRAAAHNTAVAARNMQTANEYHRRAELQRRAMMTPEQRAAVDHVLEVEQVTAAGQKKANEAAFLVVMVGILGAVLLAGPLSHLTPVLGVVALLAGLAGTVVWGARVYRRRMAQLALHLDEIEGHAR